VNLQRRQRRTARSRVPGFSGSAFRVPPSSVTPEPASYHNGAGNLSFADGHAESHQWIDPRTRPPLLRDHDLPLDVFMVNGITSLGNRDVGWLQERAYQKGD
jgi:prepilin-type processing-associated H-X9-DG protein